MDWPPQGWVLIIVSTALIGLMVAGLWCLTIRRRCPRATLIREATGRMYAWMDRSPSPSADLHSDRVAAVVVKEAPVQGIERDIRPSIPERPALALDTSGLVHDLTTITSGWQGVAPDLQNTGQRNRRGRRSGAGGLPDGGRGRFMAVLSTSAQFDDGIAGEAARRNRAQRADWLDEITTAHHVELAWYAYELPQHDLLELKERMAW